MSRGKKSAAAYVDEQKLDDFVDFVARMVARRWVQTQREQEHESSIKRDDDAKSACDIPESRPEI